MKTIEEIYRDLPDGEAEAPASAVACPRLGLPLAVLFAMIAIGFFTVLVPFCVGVQG